MVSGHRSPQNKKRHGKHQKHTKNFLSVYLPYVPLTLIVITGLLFSSYWQPRSKNGVLAYATSVGIDSLLAATNQQRAANGVGPLKLNAKLNQAAQAKANDMVARDYWAHNTPDGLEPWVFFDRAGYSYKTAGENLAYGYLDSAATITGWMNSTMGHRENLLNAQFVDVGFGIANSANFVHTGEPATIVSSEYGNPLVATAPAPASSVASASVVRPVATPAATPNPTPAAIEVTPTPVPVSASIRVDSNGPRLSPSEVKGATEPASQNISRLDVFTKGSLPWLTSVTVLLSVAAALLIVIKHGLAFRRWLVKGEQYVMHHALFDVTVISFIGLCMTVTQSAGAIR